MLLLVPIELDKVVFLKYAADIHQSVFVDYSGELNFLDDLELDVHRAYFAAFLFVNCL